MKPNKSSDATSMDMIRGRLNEFCGPLTREVLTQVFASEKMTEGPSIDVFELAQLVDQRLRGRNVCGGESDKSRWKSERVEPKTVADEIDAVLDLVEMCQVMLFIRKCKWGALPNDLCNAEPLEGSGNGNSEKQRKNLKSAEANIAKCSVPMKFQPGLIKIGLRDDATAQRTARYEKFFLECAVHWSVMSLPPGLRNLFLPQPDSRFPDFISDEIEPWIMDDGIPPEKVKEALEALKQNGWGDKESMIWVAKKYWAWHEADISNTQREKALNKSRRRFHDKAAGNRRSGKAVRQAK